jgi:hypothetical protein
MTRTLFEIEISRGINLPPITFNRFARSENDIKIEFAGEKITRISPVRSIKIGKVDLKA